MRQEKKHRGIFERPKGSGVYWIRFVDAAGRLRRERAGSWSNARDLLVKRRNEKLLGVKLPEKLRRRAVMFRELVQDALEHARAHNSLPRVYEGRAELLLSWFGDLVAESITPQQIDRKLTETAADRKWAAGTANRYKSLVSLAYSLGMRNGKVESNPARLVQARREDNGRIRFLSDEEETTLRAAIAPRFQLELDVALGTGLRLSEQYGLSRGCVDLERRQLTVPRSKNGRARHIPLNARTLAAFQWLLTAHNGEYVFPHRENALSGHAPKWFTTAIEKAGIKDFSWHCLRHTFASRLVMAGVDLRTVQELMGHRNIAMTCRYAHLAPAHQRAAVELLDRAILPSSTDTTTDTERVGAKRGRQAESLTVQ